MSGRATAERSPAQATGKARRREKTVAVLPFRNAGPPEDAYVADGITEDLVDVLSKVRDLRVRGRVSPGADADVAATGRRLGVDAVIDGALRRAGDRLRVSARVVSSEDGFQIWAGRFERSLRDAFALNDEVARAISEVLSASTSVAIRAMSGDPGTIELYLRAKHEGARAWGTDPRLEMELWEKALASAPDDPTTLAGFVAASARLPAPEGRGCSPRSRPNSRLTWASTTTSGACSSRAPTRGSAI